MIAGKTAPANVIFPIAEADVYLSNHVYGGTQITRCGVTRDGHRHNQTPDHIGGYCVSRGVGAVTVGKERPL